MKFDAAYECFRKCAALGRVGHAYVVVGDPRGVGARFVDRCVALLNCAAADKPCGRCPACRQIAAHAYPDLLWIEPASKSRLIGVDQVRELRQRMNQTAFAAGWKCGVLSAADRLSSDAPHTLLKTLEEPPGRTVIFLLTDSPQSLLPTILSRCQRVTLAEEGRPLPPEWRDRLIAIVCRTETGIAGEAGVIAPLALAGEVGRLFQEIKTQAEKETDEEAAREMGERVSADLDPDERERFKDTVKARASGRYRERRMEIMRFILDWQRDVLTLTHGCDEGLVLNAESRTLLRERARRLTPAQALRNVRTVEEMHRRFERNVEDGTRRTVLEQGFCAMASGPR